MKSELSLVGLRWVGPAGEAGEDIAGTGCPGSTPNAKGECGGALASPGNHLWFLWGLGIREERDVCKDEDGAAGRVFKIQKDHYCPTDVLVFRPWGATRVLLAEEWHYLVYILEGSPWRFCGNCIRIKDVLENRGYCSKREKKCVWGQRKEGISIELEIPMETANGQMEKSGVWEKDLKTSFEILTQSTLQAFPRAAWVEWGWWPDWRGVWHGGE